MTPQIKPGMFILTEGGQKAFVSWGIALFSDCWLTHGLLVTGEDEFIEGTYPRAKRGKLSERLEECRKQRRDWALYDPCRNDVEREKVVAAGLRYENNVYDYGNFLTYMLTGLWYEGTKRRVCSSLVAMSVIEGTGRPIFTNLRIQLPKASPWRIENLKDGRCTPGDIMRYSNVPMIHYQNN